MPKTKKCNGSLRVRNIARDARTRVKRTMRPYAVHLALVLAVVFAIFSGSHLAAQLAGSGSTLTGSGATSDQLSAINASASGSALSSAAVSGSVLSGSGSTAGSQSSASGASSATGSTLSSAAGSGSVLSGSGSASSVLASSASSDSSDSSSADLTSAPSASSLASESSSAFAWPSSSAAPIVDSTIPLTLDPVSKNTVIPSGTPAAFTLLHVTLTGSDILDASGNLKSNKAMEAIVGNLVTAQDVKNIIAQAAVSNDASAIAQAVTENSAAVSTVSASLPDGAKARTRTAVEKEVSDTLSTDSSAQAKVADIVSQDAALGLALDAAATQDVKDAVVQALVSSDSVADTAKTALENDPLTSAAVSDAMAQAVTGKETNIANAAAGSGSTTGDTPSSPILQVKLTDKSGRTFSPRFHFALGSVVLVLDPEREFTPGLYTLDVTVTNPLTNESQTLTQDFAWGVLAMNMDSDAYQVNDTGSLAIGVLDDSGAIVCDATVHLSVTSPSGTVTQYSTQKGNFLSSLLASFPSPIVVTGTCGQKDSMNVSPDYVASIPFKEAGTYTLALTADTKNGTRSMTEMVTVGGNPPVIVSRNAATRLYPVGSSPMDITVSFNADFSGTITDTVPGDFKILDATPDALVNNTASGKTLTWIVSEKAGSAATLHYIYDAPDVSPDFFTVGPLQFTPSDSSVQTFAEQRVWEIANDDDSTSQYIGGNGDGWATASGGILQFPSLTATASPWTDVPDGAAPYAGGDGDGWGMGAGGAVTWTGMAGDGKFSTPENWSDNVVPTSTDTVIFDGTSTGAVTIDTNVNVKGVSIAAGYTGTITQASGKTVTAYNWTESGGTLIGGDSAITIGSTFTLSNGTFTGGSGTINFYRFTLSGGAFTASAGTTTFSGPFTHTGGTFNANNGTVVKNSEGTLMSVSGTDTFHNLTIDNANPLGIYGTLLVLGSLHLTHASNFEGNGTIEARGGITIGSEFAPGGSTVTLLIDGTGDQSFTVPDGAYVPGINLDGNVATTISFAGANSGIGRNGNGNLTIQKGTFNAPSGSFPLYHLTLSGGTFNASAGTISIGGDFVHTGGTFNANNGTIVLNGWGTNVDVPTAETFQNLTINKGGNYTLIGGGDTLVVNGTLTLDQSWMAYGAINVKGNIVVDAGWSNQPGYPATALILSGTGAQTFTNNGGTIPSGTFTINKPSGTVTLGSDLSFNASGQNLTLTSGTLDLNGHNLTVNGTFSMAAGTTLKLHGNETLSAGSKSIDPAAEVIYTGDGDGSPSTTTVTPMTGMHNVTFAPTDASDTLRLASTLSVSGNISVEDGTLDLNGQGVTGGGSSKILVTSILQAHGNETLSGIALDPSSGTVEFSGNGDGNSDTYTITNLAQTYYKLWINSTDSADTYLLGSNIKVNGNLTIANGTLDVSADNHAVTVAGSFTDAASGSFNARSGAVTMSGGGTVNSKDAFSNLTMSGSTVVSSSSLVGHWPLNEGAGTVANDTSGNGNNGTITGATWTNGQLGLPGNGSYGSHDVATPMNMSGGGNGTLTAWVNPNVLGPFGIFDNEPSGLFIRTSGQGNISAGVHGAVGGVGASFFSSTSAWYYLTVVWNGANASIYKNGLLVANGSTSSNFSLSSFAIGLDDTGGFNGSISDVRIYNTALTAAQVHALASGNEPGYRLGAALHVHGNLTMQGGTLDASSSRYPITVAGNWTGNGGSLTGSGTVTLNGTNQHIAGSGVTFYDLSKTATGADTLTFTHGATVTVTHDTLLEGTGGNVLSLRSDLPGSRWSINPAASGRTIQYVSVQDSANVNATTIMCEADCRNAGNDAGWLFPLQGRLTAADGTTPIAGKTIALSVNGGAIVGSGVTASDGTYALNPGNLSGSQLLALYIKGDSSVKGATVTVTDGMNTSEMNVWGDTLIVRNETGSEVTNANLATAEGNGDSDLTAVYQVSGDNLTVQNGTTLYVPAGQTFTPGGTITASSLIVRGTLNGGSNAVTVTNSLDANGGTITGTGLYSFNGNGTVSASGTTLPSVSFNNPLFGFSKRKQITISHASVDSDLTDFPLLVKITNDAEIGAGARSDGHDIRFTDTSGNVLPYERESFSVTDGSATGIFWVKVPQISHSADTTIYAYYGKSNAPDGNDPANVWTNGYAGVWHMDETGTPATWANSTSNSYGTITNFGISATTGKIGGGAVDDGSQYGMTPAGGDGYGLLPNHSVTQLSFGFWAKPVSLPTGANMFGQTIDGFYGWGVYLQNGDGNGFTNRVNAMTVHCSVIPYGGKPYYDFSLNNAFDTTTGWHYYYFTFDGAIGRIYKDGVSQTVDLRDGNNNSWGYGPNVDSTAFGTIADNQSSMYTGAWDEAHLSSIARSPAWIKFEYQNEENGQLNWGTESATPDSVWTLSSPLHTSGNLTVGTGALFNVQGSALTVGGTLENDGTLELRGSEPLSAGTSLIHGQTIFTGNGSYSGLAGLTSFHHLTLSGAGTWTLANPVAVTGDLRIQTGSTLLQNGKAMTMGGSWTDTETPPWSTYVDDGSGNLLLTGSGGRFAFVGSGTTTFTGSGTLSEPGRFGNIVLNAPSQIVTLASPLSVSGSLTLAQGMLQVGSGNPSIAVDGNWTNSGGNFSAGSGTVALTGGNQTLSGSTLFWNLDKEVSSNATLTFAAGSTQGIRGLWTARGSLGETLRLRSSSTGAQWRINPAAEDLQYIDVRDSNNISGTTIVAANDAVNSGDNTGWAFYLAVAVTDKNGVAVGSGVTVNMAVNGGPVVTSVTNAQGIASFNDGQESHTVSGISSGAILGMWLPKGTGTGATVDVTNGTTLGFALQQSTITLRNDVGSAVTNSQLSVASASGSNTDLNAVYTMSGTELVAADNTTLKIPTGVTYTPGGQVNADDFRVAGTFHMGTNNVTVRGSWDATGGKFDGTNTVSFTSTTDETITVNKNSFANVVFVTGNNPLGQVGKWTTTDKLSVTGNQSIVNGAVNPEKPPVLSAATVTPVYDRLAVVNWTTDTASTSKILYGTDSGAFSTMVFPGSGQTLDTGHAVTLTGLSPATTYYGRAISADYWGNTGTGAVFSFTTMDKLSTQQELAEAEALAEALGKTEGAGRSHLSFTISSSSVVSSAPVAIVSGSGSSESGSGSVASVSSTSAEVCDSTRVPVSITNLAASVGSGSAVVTWRTNQEALSIIRFGVDAVGEREKTDTIFDTNHDINILALRPSTTYHLQAIAADRCGSIATSPEISFQTASGSLTDQELQDLELHAAAGNADPQTVQRALKLLQNITSSLPVNQLAPMLLAESTSLMDMAQGLPGPVISGQPKVVVTDSTATISWSTDEASNSLVSFADTKSFRSGSYSMTSGDPQVQTTAHAVTLVGLQPGTLYHYPGLTLTKCLFR